MNGAEAMLRTLADSGVRLCLANPGTSEMHMVAALDQFADVLRTHPLAVKAVHAADTTESDFRRALTTNLADSRDYIVVNWLRSKIDQEPKDKGNLLARRSLLELDAARAKATGKSAIGSVAKSNVKRLRCSSSMHSVPLNRSSTLRRCAAMSIVVAWSRSTS